MDLHPILFILLHIQKKATLKGMISRHIACINKNSKFCSFYLRTSFSAILIYDLTGEAHHLSDKYLFMPLKPNFIFLGDHATLSFGCEFVHTNKIPIFITQFESYKIS